MIAHTVRRPAAAAAAALVAVALAGTTVGIQAQTSGATRPAPMQHTPGMNHDSAVAARAAGGARPTLAGQDAYAAIAEVVRLLEADPSTDWSAVDVERLRRHLIDMNEVTLHAAVSATPVADGLTMDVTGEGRTVASIRAMLRPHAEQLDASPEYRARATEIPGGVRLVVTTRRPGDAAAVAKLRALGFAGLLTVGDHHAAHHLALARGSGMGH